MRNTVIISLVLGIILLAPALTLGLVLYHIVEGFDTNAAMFE